MRHGGFKRSKCAPLTTADMVASVNPVPNDRFAATEN